MTPDEMVKYLREKAGAFDYQGWTETAIDYELAADALEKLNRKVEALEAMREISPEAEYTINKHADNLISHMEELISGLKDKPRWIPVTERLPEKNQIVVAHEGKGTWDFGMFRGISPSGNPEYWHWKKNTFKRVKWWMPKDGALPEPPKEK